MRGPTLIARFAKETMYGHLVDMAYKLESDNGCCSE